MKRLRVVACWGSMLLLAALAAAMLRSFAVADGFTWTAWDGATGTYHGRIIALRSGRGVVGMELMHVSTSLKPMESPVQESDRGGFVWQRVDASSFHLPRETLWQRIGFGWTTHAQPVSGMAGWRMRSTTVWMPYWLPIGLAVVAPVGALLRHGARQRRRRRGLCPHCGYDLRASSGQCPECGTPITGTTPSTGTPRRRG